MKGMIVSLLFIIFLIGLLVFLLSFLIHQRKILQGPWSLMGTVPMLLAIDNHLSTHKFIIKERKWIPATLLWICLKNWLPKPLLEKRDASKLLDPDRKNRAIPRSPFWCNFGWIRSQEMFLSWTIRAVTCPSSRRQARNRWSRRILLLDTQDDCWEVLAKPAKRLKVGASVSFGEMVDRPPIVEEELEHGGRIVRFHYQGIF